MRVAECNKDEVVDANTTKDKGDDWFLVFTNERDWFSTYSSIDSGVVRMENGSLCKINGIRTVQIRKHYRIIMTLLSVKHVPDLEKNILSMLDSKKCRIVIESSSIKVFHRALILIKGGNHDSLYVL
ncbi:hypothetical protein J1N35_021291 [Gossypium stocksii]|uniref:Retrovirus-related Pol polyprotein from transposon TNT 1-94-like beta-barrel domain-containing protein n=1 Tax=Gossypium stocksii TaxID=47602 RepID=A0A9D3VE00_9ROSI|nr:hypothetical protein J1N35_021291 [Gossypium stocksii]